MVRKNDRRKPVGDGRKGAGGRDGDGSGAKSGAGHASALKRAGGGSAKAAAPAPKGAKLAMKPAAAAPLPKVKFRGKMLENEPLARYTTYRLGGPARYFLTPADPEDVAKALELAHDRGLPWLALGLGSNVLVKDTGYPGVVIRLGKGLDRFEMKGATAIVGAGLATPLLARRTAEAGFAGVERFIGIPGTVGGGVYMNAGAHGAEFAEVLTEATVMDAKGKIKQVGRKQISFKYRSSNLGSVIVLEAKLALIEEPPAKLKERQARLFRWRKAGTPFDQPSSGSVFKNPSGPRTAGMLIDEAGLKGFTIGGAQVSTLHANYIVNTGAATASDVLKVIEHVRKTVAKKTAVELELEVKVIGT
jgi:UDP-N-acetylmuramate dehydrogenase